MEKKRKSTVYYIRKFSEAGASFLLYPILILSLSFINFCLDTDVNVYLLISLFVLSSLFAYCSWGGEKLEKENESNKNNE